MGNWARLLAPLLALVLSSPSPLDPNVRTHGGNGNHTNYYPDQSPPFLCRDWQVELTGHSFTQPLLVGNEVYQLGGDSLYRLDLTTGQQLGVMLLTHDSQHRNVDSKGQMTYHQTGPEPSPEADWLFVPTPGPPYGLVALHPAEIRPDLAVPTGRRWEIPNPNAYIVTAPLYFPDSGAVVFGTNHATPAGDEQTESSSGEVWAVWSLTGEESGGYPDFSMPGAGWISGSPVKTRSDQFVIGVRDGVRRVTIENGRLVSGPDDLFKTVGEVLTSLAGQPSIAEWSYPMAVYANDDRGYLYAVDPQTMESMWEMPQAAHHIPGFSNAGPAVDDSFVYMPLRWEGNEGNSETPGSEHGVIAAFSRTTGELAWKRTLDAYSTPGRPSWVNQEPIVFGGGEYDDGAPKPRVTLVGDVGGRVSAWGLNGEPMPVAIVDAEKAPVDCSRLESADYTGGVAHSPVVHLTADPLVVTQPAWSNRSGVGSGLIFARDRLITGVNQANGHSRLVSLRAGTDVWIQSMVLRQNGDVKSADRIDLKLPVEVELRVGWYVAGEGRSLGEIPVLVGWADRAPSAVENLQVIQPGADPGVRETTLTFTLPPRGDGARRAEIVALLNPGLYLRRQAGEEGAEPPPTAWATLLAGYANPSRLAELGEVLVRDNLSVQPVGEFAPPVVNLWAVPQEVCVGQPVTYHVRYWDPLGASQQAEERGPEVWPSSYDTPGQRVIQYRAQNSAGYWSPWAEQRISVRQCNSPLPQVGAWFDLSFDPPTGHRGHTIHTAITVHPQITLNGHTVTSFQVDQVEVALPAALRDLKACVSYQPCWEAPNDDPTASGADLAWTYDFEIPAPSPTPEDGDYTLTVSAHGTYTWEEWVPNYQWHSNWVTVCNPNPLTGEEECSSVDLGGMQDDGAFVERTGTWASREEKVYRIEGGHDFLHPVTDYEG